MEQQRETEAKSGADTTADICTAATKPVECNWFLVKDCNLNCDVCNKTAQIE